MGIPQGHIRHGAGKWQVITGHLVMVFTVGLNGWLVLAGITNSHGAILVGANHVS